jgi:hypothetical protein
VGGCGGRESAEIPAEAVEVPPPEAPAVLVFVAMVDEMHYMVEILELFGGVWRMVGRHYSFYEVRC